MFFFFILYFSCTQFGAIVGNSAAGFLIYYYQNWHVSFYTFGVIGILVGLLYVSIARMLHWRDVIYRNLYHWLVVTIVGFLPNYFVFDQMFLCANSPNVHPCISETEKQYLQKEIGQLERDRNLKTVPWRAICTSKPVIALLLSIVSSSIEWSHFSVKPIIIVCIFRWWATGHTTQFWLICQNTWMMCCM